jgi:uncharacterized protein YkwD
VIGLLLLAWPQVTASPAPLKASELPAREAELVARCGVADAKLRAAAQRLAQRKAAGHSAPDMEGLAFMLRAAGDPHVWPRAWIVSGRALESGALAARFDAWTKTFRDPGERRCGVATLTTRDGTEIVTAVAVDALGDLSPLPARTFPGQWLTLEASLDAAVTSARVILVGPGGAPRTVPTSFQDGRVRARFTCDRPGAFNVQVLADVATGPRPVLEARVFASVEPPDDLPGSNAPGEEAGAGIKEADLALFKMASALRASQSLPPLIRDSRLDALARTHAEKMARARTLGHDVGGGDPAARFHEAGLRAREAGENVAHARNAVEAHRSLYASPSHRVNLVRHDFDRVGIGVFTDPDGTLWACQLFAAGLR